MTKMRWQLQVPVVQVSQGGLSKLTVKDLRDEIHARGLKQKGLKKMNKTQLLSLLQ